MIRPLRKFLSAALTAAIALAAPGTASFAAEIVRIVPVAPPVAGAGAAASSLAPLGLGSMLPAAADGPRAALTPSALAPAAAPTPSPWNPAAPTVLYGPVSEPAPASSASAVPAIAQGAAAKAKIGAASMPPVVGAASMPPIAGAKTNAPKQAWKDADSPAAKASRAAAKAAAWFRALPFAGNGELPPPADAVDSLKAASLDIEAGRKSHPSPEDWRDESLYSVVLDRFARGKKAKPYGDPESGLSRHGGDIRGLIDRLDYIKESGVTTLLVSPVTMTVPEAYHGYAPVHFLAVDPHLGTMADFKELVAKAHEKGLRVVLDWVINHAGPVFEYADGKTQWTGDGKAGPVEWTRTLKPVEFTAEDFSRKRVITDWNDHTQATEGDFPPNYRHFATDRPETQAKLIHVMQWWMKETDIDGLRLDAVRHVAPGFLPIFTAAIKDYAGKLGKKNFLMLGENSTGIDSDLKPYLADGSLDTLYDYPAYRRENAALHGAAPTRALENSRAESVAALGDAADRLTRFIDLHDTYRFLLSDTPGEILKTALAYVMTGAGIPIVYYGTEQAFRQLHGRLTPEGGDLPADPQNREDMFDGGAYKSASSAGDKFDQGSETFKFLRALSDLRKAYPALTRGEQYPRWSDPNGAGIYAFSRIHEGQEVLVVLNTSGEARSAEMWVDANISPAGTALEDALNPGYAIKSAAAGLGSKVGVSIPAYGVRVLVRAATPAP